MQVLVLILHLVERVIKMTIQEINDLEEEVKEANYVVNSLEELKDNGIKGEFTNELFTGDYHQFRGHGFQKSTIIGDAVLSSMRFEWEVFEIHLVLAREKLIKLTKQLQLVNGYLNNIRISD